TARALPRARRSLLLVEVTEEIIAGVAHGLDYFTSHHRLAPITQEIWWMSGAGSRPLPSRGAPIRSQTHAPAARARQSAHCVGVRPGHGVLAGVAHPPGRPARQRP